MKWMANNAGIFKDKGKNKIYVERAGENNGKHHINIEAQRGKN